MNINTYADVDVVAVEQQDEVSVMVELTAPTLRTDRTRPPATVQVVLDRSGSMGGEPLETAKDALIRLVDRLDPADSFGLVVFDDTVDVVVPSGRIRDKRAAKHAIAAIHPGGSTNLAGGLMRGLQEAQRSAGRAGATVVLLSDGHANHGETNPDRVAHVTTGYRTRKITTSTIGLGRGYDEALLAAIAGGGDGNHTFAESADGAAAILAAEVEGLLSMTVQAASLIVRPEASVDSVTIWNDLPSTAIDGGIMVELGDLWAGEERKLLLTFAVPAMAALGLAQIAALELRYVALPEFAEQTVTIPVHVNVVPGDQAAGRIPDPRVHTELVFQRVQRDKRAAGDALRAGDDAAAARHLGRAQRSAGLAHAAAPSAEWAEELDVLRRMRGHAEAGDAEWSIKTARMEERKLRKRGRRDLRDGE